MFKSARLKLTLWYLLGIMAISLIFSSIIYQGLMSEVYRFEKAQRFRIESRFEEGIFIPEEGRIFKLHRQIPVNDELIEETRNRIIIMLVALNSGILLISGLLGYLLAGRTLEPIKDMMEEQNRFISDASHEFRTPLTSLKTAFEVYLRNNKPDLGEAKSVISESIVEVNKLQSLSESLLQLTQYQKPNGHSKFEILSVNSVLKEAMHKVKNLAKQKNITIKNDDEDFKVKGNMYALTDLFVILLDNAIKYSPNKTTVNMYKKMNAKMVHIEIEDMGIGIPKSDIPHIFDRFYRADSARAKSTDGGYGLGLSIAKKITELHKGSITVKSNSKKGSTFIIKIPLHSSH